jgi:hypothetical protein
VVDQSLQPYGQDIVHGVVVQSDVVLEHKQDHELVLILILNVEIADALDLPLKPKHVEELSHQRSGQDMEHGVHVQEVVVVELKQEDVLVSILILLVILHVLVPLPKQNLVVIVLLLAGGVDMEHGVLVQ